MTTYAVQAMLYLASQPRGRVLSLKEIANQQGIKAKYLEQIFMKLNRAGLVKSKKGPGGGYYIDQPVDAIKIGDIMDAVGEKNVPVRCLADDSETPCARVKGCFIRPYWKRMQDQIDKFLNSSTLYDILRNKE